MSVCYVRSVWGLIDGFVAALVKCKCSRLFSCCFFSCFFSFNERAGSPVAPIPFLPPSAHCCCCSTIELLSAFAASKKANNTAAMQQTPLQRAPHFECLLPLPYISPPLLTPLSPLRLRVKIIIWCLRTTEPANHRTTK